MTRQLLERKLQKAYKLVEEMANREREKMLAIEELKDEYQAEQTQRSDEQELENAQRI